MAPAILTALTIPVFATLAGGLLAVRFRHLRPLLIACGAGLLLGAAFLDLLPEAIVLGADGATQYVCYHAWDVARTARRLCIDPLAWVPDGAGGVAPRCLGPTTEPQPIPRTDTAPTHP